MCVLQAHILQRCWPLYEMWSTLVGKGPQAVQLTCPGGEGGRDRGALVVGKGPQAVQLTCPGGEGRRGNREGR